MVWMYKNKKEGFTFVELIVVMTILTILGTLAFNNLFAFRKNGRDAVRVTDLSSLGKSLDFFKANTWFYPLPNSNIDITYTGWLAWSQWIISDAVIQNFAHIDKKPVDPLTQKEYTYSVMNIRTEYSLWGIMESSQLIADSEATSQNKDIWNAPYALVMWNYNWKILVVNTWWIDYILALPSIITTDFTFTDVASILQNKTLVYNGYSNVPVSYASTLTWWFDFFSPNTLIFSGNLSELSNLSGQLELANNLKIAYQDTIIAKQKDFQQIGAIDVVDNIDFSANIIKDYIANNVGWLYDASLSAMIYLWWRIFPRYAL